MFLIIIQMIVSTFIISSFSIYFSNNNFWYHLIICFVLMVLCILGGMYRNEDLMRPGSGQRRYFMMFGQCTVISFFIGICAIYVFTNEV